MRSTLVLSGDVRDADTAALWATDEARKAKFTDHLAKAFGGKVLNAYRTACDAFFGQDGAREKLMICLDLSQKRPRFELITDGELARGVVSSANGLGAAERRRKGHLDGLTCVSIPS